MSQPKSFQEYINAKGGKGGDDVGSEKAKVALIADYPGDKNNTPPQGGANYTAPGAQPPKGHQADGPDKGGFANDGDKKLVYKPKVEGTYEREQVKTKTQEWLDTTKELSLSEFAKEIRHSALDGIDEGESPTDNIRQTVANCKMNPNLMESLLREIKRADLLEAFVVQAFQLPEAFSGLAKLMETSDEGDVICRRLVRAMNEIVGPPAHDMDDEDDPNPDDLGDEEMGDEDMSHLNLGDEDMGDEDMGDEDMGDEDMGDEDMEGDLDAPMPHKKHGHNMLDAMKNSPRMAMAMKQMMQQ
jgi:hypothetical protein